MTRATAPTTNEESVRAISKTQDEPEWLLDRRLEAWRAFEAMSMPDPLDEEWRRTDISGLNLNAVLEGDGNKTSGVILPGDLMEANGYGSVIVQSDGESAGYSRGGSLPDGVVFTDLATAAREHPDVVQKYLGSVVKPDEWKIGALAAAVWQGGVFIHVPRGVEVKLPLHFAAGEAGALGAYHVLIVAEDESSVTLVQDTYSADSSAQTLVTGTVEIVCKPYAKVGFYEVQRWGNSVYNFSTIRAALDNGAELTSGLIGLGGRLTKTRLEAIMHGTGAKAELLGLSFGDDKQHFDYATLQDHIAPRTASDLLFKAALAGESSQVWYGTARIRKGASASEANQTNRNLLLSDSAKAAPIPVLEIEAHDVLRCSHGATAGPLDEDQRFYLESRGIPPVETERLLVEAFFMQVVDRLPLESIRERVAGVLAERVAEAR